MNDVSAEHPNKMQELKELLKNYSATLVPQLNQPYDPVRADPAKFNNVWSPWEDWIFESGASVVSTVTVTFSAPRNKEM